MDADVTVADSDSSDFNNGWLKISYDDPRVGSENQLSLLSPGGGLSISGSVVYLGVDPIGTLVGDGSDGAAIEITFSSPLATPAVVELLIESLHYQNTSLAPDTEVVLLIEVNDGDGETSDPARLSITVTADGTSVDDNATGTEDVPVVIAFADLLANDTGFDSTVSVTSVSAAVNGTVTIVGSNVVFTPTADYDGAASFTYTASDGTDSDSANVALTIAAVNDAPTLALTQTISDIDENTDTSARIKVADIVVSDDALGTNTLALTGADATSFEIDGTELFLSASVALDFESLDSFDVAVTVEDASVGSNPDDNATVSLVVNDLNEPATGAPVISGTAAELQVLTADTSSIADDDGIDAGTVALQWRRDGAAIPGATANSYTVTAADVGAAISLSYRYTDDLGATDTLTSAATSPVVATDQTLPGSSGADLLEGGAGADSLSGGSGDDTLRGGDGADSLDGGSGSNRLNGNGGDDVLTSGADSTGDLIYGGSGNDSASGGAGTDTIFGQDGDDVLSGGQGADFLVGQLGNDTLSGGAQQDSLFGGDGNDFLNGGFAFDVLNGGAGADRFYHAGVVGHGTDWVQDYNAADGDVLIFGLTGATQDDFSLLAFHSTGSDGERAGDDAIQELYVVYSPTGQKIWALVDGADQDEILLRVAGSGETFDLLA